MPRLLNDQERNAMRLNYPAWQMLENRAAISRTFLFPDFKIAFAFMQQCAEYAEKIDHHPEWLNIWNRLEVVLATHSAGGLTSLDLQLAEFMDRTANSIGLQQPGA